MKHCVEDIEHLRFKLRMFGIPLDEHKPETGILRDDQALPDGMLLQRFVQQDGLKHIGTSLTP